MKTVAKYYKKYIPIMLAVVLLVLGQAMGELALPKLMSNIINYGIVASDLSYIRREGLVMIAVAAATLVFSTTGGVFASITAARTTRDLRHDLFRHVTGFSSKELDSFSTASLITRTTNDMQMIQQATVMMLRIMLFAPIMGAGAIYMALNTSLSLSWTVVLALICVLCLMIFSFIVIFPRFRVMQEKLDKINLIIKERLSGILVIRAFTTEKHEQDRFDFANKDLTKLYIFVNKAMSFMMPTMSFIMSAVGVLIVWVGAHLIDSGSLMIGDMLAYLQYAMHVIMSFMFVTMIFVMVPRAAVSAKRVGEVLDTEFAVKDPEGNAACEETEHNCGKVEFRNVTFAYSESGEPAVKNINFTAEPGQTTAIIGGTGSGKSTLVNLAVRFYDVTDGAVLVDGTDVRDMKQEHLRNKIGLVPQKGTLFSGTIESNLRYGNEAATEEELADAAETAQAMEFISSKPNGMKEEISQGGTNVSGGQKQRLCIARALVKKPEILIFDDSFSALDFSTDLALRRALEKKAAGSTVIIVAQRINTIIGADKIVVLDEGEIAGCGTHRELMKNCEVYREIALSQLSEEEMERSDC
ncbi:MAG: ABC transporter ATP-binding protein [Firmicutes bacterium]|nr:ABC transporter ATP-binding protein [Bacillota bacterium]